MTDSLQYTCGRSVTHRKHAGGPEPVRPRAQEGGLATFKGRWRLADAARAQRDVVFLESQPIAAHPPAHDAAGVVLLRGRVLRLARIHGQHEQVAMAELEQVARRGKSTGGVIHRDRAVLGPRGRVDKYRGHAGPADRLDLGVMV